MRTVDVRGPSVSIVRIPEEHQSRPDKEILLTVEMDTIVTSEENALRLRNALCIMFGRPGKGGKKKL